MLMFQLFLKLSDSELIIPALTFSLNGIKETPFQEKIKRSQGPDGKLWYDPTWPDFF